MLATRWIKVLNDLWENKTRTLLIVLSIAVGLFAVGTIVSAEAILSTEMSRSFATITPSTGTVRTIELFDENFIRSVRQMPAVAEADARRAMDTRVQIGPNEWVNLRLFAVPDYNDIRVNKINPESGAWPPPPREILIERAALPLLNAGVGDLIALETPDEKVRYLRIAGEAHDPAQIPAQFDNSPYGYVSFDTLDWFGEAHGFNELYIVSMQADDATFAQQTLNDVKNKAERAGLTIPLSTTAEPGQLPMDEVLQGILLLMGVLGVLSLFLSLFLIVNTISALLAQQKRQIGVMKAIGAGTDQVLGMYLGMVLIYGGMALLLAVPLSWLGSRSLSHFMAGMFNFDLLNVQPPLYAVLLQVGVGLLVPVLASLYPFLSSLRVSAAEAMNTDRLGKGRFGGNFIDRSLSGANLWIARYVLPRSLILSTRNIFRRKGRLLLTLLTLTLAGSTFISVISLQDSLNETLDGVMQMWNFDTMIVFRRPYRAEHVQRKATELSEVTAADVWLQLPVRRVRPDGSEGGALFMFAPRPGSDMVPGPAITDGRWLMPGDENALVADALLLRDEPDLRLGGEVVLKVEGREVTFRIVGVSLGIVAPIVYAPYDYIAEITSRSGEADVALVSTAKRDYDAIQASALALERHFDQQGLRVASVATIAAERAEGEAFFAVIITLLLIMAFMLAVVGGLGLMGTMSINVLERTREVGVLRAIGAPDRGVSLVFIREGVAIGLLSWLLGTICAYPLGRMLSTGVGTAVMGTPFTYAYSISGLLIWLVLVIMLSALASFLPARSASRLTVREVLAYE